MLLFGLISSPLEFIIYILALVIALTFHEAAHAYMALVLGDDTPKLMGRLSLNPLAHLDLWGSIMMLLVGFGWGKPVMVNPRHFENPKLDNLTVSLAGPVANFLLAAIFGLVLRFIPMPSFLQNGLQIFVFFNLTLMIFNLLPIPPLDGSKILGLFVSDTTYIYLQQIGFYILIALILFSSQIPVISFLMTRVVGFIFTLLTGQTIAL
jgi:Zn-dependent protease